MADKDLSQPTDLTDIDRPITDSDNRPEGVAWDLEPTSVKKPQVEFLERLRLSVTFRDVD